MKLTNLGLLALLLIIVAFSVVASTKEGYRKKMPSSPAQSGYTVAGDSDYDFPFF